MIKYLSTIVLTVALCCACDGEDFSDRKSVVAGKSVASSGVRGVGGCGG